MAQSKFYGGSGRTPLCWTEVGERHEIEPAMIQETVEQMEMLEAWVRKPMTAEELRG